jgi:hypothetical protein
MRQGNVLLNALAEYLSGFIIIMILFSITEVTQGHDSRSVAETPVVSCCHSTVPGEMCRVYLQTTFQSVQSKSEQCLKTVLSWGSTRLRKRIETQSCHSFC